MGTSTTADRAPTRPHGSYADVGGVATYYEVSGVGDPVVLLHGGLCTAETFDPQTTALAERYRVYVPERPGHGRTRDVDGPYSYEAMAAHTIGFMDALDLQAAHLAGWSDGALVGLLVALRRPMLVRKLALIEQFVTLDGADPDFLPMLTGLTAELAPPHLVALYGALSPDGPEHFELVFGKLHALWTGATGIEVADLCRVATPTLLLAGDAGASSLEHLDAVRRALPDAELAVVPGTSHGAPLEKPHIVNRLLLDFFADVRPEPLFPFSPTQPTQEDR